MAIRPKFLCSLALMLGAATSPLACADAPASPPAAPADAAQLVQAALEAELAGDADQRAELLTQAVAADAEYAPARWQSGQVKFAGQWRPVADVAELVRTDPRWRQYDELRQSLAGTPQDHEDVARWCYRQGLENEERYHWLHVIAADPQHQLARDRLKAREYQGGLYTHEQIAAHEKQVKQAKANLKAFKPKFHEICRRASDSDSQVRSAALRELRGVDDLAAIEALENVIERESRQASDELTLELRLAMIGALSNMPHHDATLRLLEYSLYAPQPEVRAAAARALKPRPVTDYVPLLMALLTAPIEGEIEAFASADGTVSYGEFLFQAGPEADLAVVRGEDRVAIAFEREGREVEPSAIARAVDRNHMNANLQAMRARNQVAIANAQADARNSRVREVLFNALEINLGTDPKAYWQAWQSYNELSYEEHPTYRFEDKRAYVTPVVAHSCFKAGTPVWTQAGPQPIETIAIGDLVLAQNAATGEIAFRPVLQTTIGPLIKTIDVQLPTETITSTLGHRFWVNGRGWVMAKALQAGAQLHSLQASIDVKGVGQGEMLQCHNLVVGDFHTFFVGESRILVHDKSCPAPAIGYAPGDATPRQLQTAGLKTSLTAAP